MFKKGKTDKRPAKMKTMPKDTGKCPQAVAGRHVTSGDYHDAYCILCGQSLR